MTYRTEPVRKGYPAHEAMVSDTRSIHPQWRLKAAHLNWLLLLLNSRCLWNGYLARQAKLREQVRDAEAELLRGQVHQRGG